MPAPVGSGCSGSAMTSVGSTASAVASNNSASGTSAKIAAKRLQRPLRRTRPRRSAIAAPVTSMAASSNCDRRVLRSRLEQIASIGFPTARRLRRSRSRRSSVVRFRLRARRLATRTGAAVGTGVDRRLSVDPLPASGQCRMRWIRSRAGCNRRPDWPSSRMRCSSSMRVLQHVERRGVARRRARSRWLREERFELVAQVAHRADARHARAALERVQQALEFGDLLHDRRDRRASARTPLPTARAARSLPRRRSRRYPHRIRRRGRLQSSSQSGISAPANDRRGWLLAGDRPAELASADRAVASATRAQWS